MRKTDFCQGENKGADQLRGNRDADQYLCRHGSYELHHSNSISCILWMSGKPPLREYQRIKALSCLKTYISQAQCPGCSKSLLDTKLKQLDLLNMKTIICNLLQCQDLRVTA